jgi:GNAT superfamily N-acetyltransferase
MNPSPLHFEVIHAPHLSHVDFTAIQALCTRAYEEDVWCYYGYLQQAYHVLGRIDGVIVCHALWVDRSLIAGQGAALKTAYVEYVATEPTLQGQGLASRLLRYLLQAVEVTARYALAGLSPAESAFYERLGWALWDGALYIRQGDQLIETPDDVVMIHRLAHTPPLDLDDDLSAEWREGELW